LTEETGFLVGKK